MDAVGLLPWAVVLLLEAKAAPVLAWALKVSAHGGSQVPAGAGNSTLSDTGFGYRHIVSIEGPSYEERAARVRQLQALTEPLINDQHVVSKVLLKRFAMPRKGQGLMVSEFDLEYGKSKPRSCGQAGKVDRFVRLASKSAEAKWQEVEDRMPAAFQAVDDGTLFDHPDHVSAIRDVIALHFARSIQTAIVHERSWRGVTAAARKELLANGDVLALLSREFFGLDLVGPEGHELLIDRTLADSNEVFESGVLFRETVENLFERLRNWMPNYGLEIWTPERGQFLIGDIPALTLPREGNGVGVLGNVALFDANTLVLPLGSYSFAALGPRESDEGNASGIR